MLFLLLDHPLRLPDHPQEALRFLDPFEVPPERVLIVLLHQLLVLLPLPVLYLLPPIPGILPAPIRRLVPLLPVAFFVLLTPPPQGLRLALLLPLFPLPLLNLLSPHQLLRIVAPFVPSAEVAAAARQAAETEAQAVADAVIARIWTRAVEIAVAAAEVHTTPAA